MKLKKYIQLASVCLLIMAQTAPAGESTLVYSFKEGDSLRSIAGKYLDDPNQWKVILLYNGFNALSQIKPGTKISIPTRLYKKTISLLDKAREATREANMEGAGVLAKKTIEESIFLREEALELKNQGALKESGEKAALSLKLAQKALKETKAKKIRSVSAVLAKKQGNLQSKKPVQTVWKEAEIKQEFIEKERVRTLAKSRGEILFVDGSDMRLNENSLAVIGAMKENLVKKSIKTSVTILRGDILVHLASLSKRKEFVIKTPGVGTAIRSRKFRTSRDLRKVTRIANYDGEIDVRARGLAVTIKKNEGTKIESGKAPQAPKKLLPPPEIISPGANGVFHSGRILFHWKKVKGAVKYIVEISDKRDFSVLLHSFEEKGERNLWKAPGAGIYYYRIHVIDREGLAGPFSDVLDFFVEIDVTAPYLAVHAPGEGAVVLGEETVVKGEVEKGALLAINKTPVDYAPDGLFQRVVKLNKGSQSITVEATDTAGNKTVIKRTVSGKPEESLILLNTPSRLMVNKGQVSITGRILPGVKVEINKRPLPLSGKFSYVASLPEGEEIIVIKGTAPNGKTETREIRVLVDLTRPDILPDPFAAFTKKDGVTLSGKLSEDALLKINGDPVPVTNMEFKHNVKLTQGRNPISIVAVDPVGNRSEKSINITRDSLPPKIKHIGLPKKTTKGGEVITLVVSARDSGAGLARTGRFVLTVGDRMFNGILTAKGASSLTGSLFIPPGAAGKVVVKTVRLRDRLGNVAVYP